MTTTSSTPIPEGGGHDHRLPAGSGRDPGRDRLDWRQRHDDRGRAGAAQLVLPVHGRRRSSRPPTVRSLRSRPARFIGGSAMKGPRCPRQNPPRPGSALCATPVGGRWPRPAVRLTRDLHAEASRRTDHRLETCRGRRTQEPSPATPAQEERDEDRRGRVLGIGRRAHGTRLRRIGTLAGSTPAPDRAPRRSAAGERRCPHELQNVLRHPRPTQRRQGQCHPVHAWLWRSTITRSIT